MINSLLVRWGGGWAEVRDDAAIAALGRRSEALLGLGAAQSIAEVNRIATRQLEIYRDPRTAIKVSPIIAGPETVPRLGDRVTVPDMDGTPVLERVMARTFSEDEDGVITMAADVRDVLLSRAERWEQAIKKMSDGTIRGDSKVATPASQVDLPDPSCCPPVPPASEG